MYKETSVVDMLIMWVQNIPRPVQIYWQTFILFQLTLLIVVCMQRSFEVNVSQTHQYNNSVGLLCIQEQGNLFVCIMNHIKLFVFCVFTKPILWVILLPSEFNPPYNQTFYNGMLYERTGYQLSKQNRWNKKVFASLS